MDLVEGSERLLSLTDILNLEDCDKSRVPACNLYPFVDDFHKLRHRLCEQRKILCSYGLDSPSFDNELFRQMKVLASQLFLHSDATMAYCTLKSQLFLEQNDFFDEIFLRMNGRLESCKSEDESERVLLAVVRLRSIYDVYLPCCTEGFEEVLVPAF